MLCRHRHRGSVASCPHPTSSPGCWTDTPQSSSLQSAEVGTGLAPLAPAPRVHTSVCRYRDEPLCIKVLHTGITRCNLCYWSNKSTKTCTHLSEDSLKGCSTLSRAFPYKTDWTDIFQWCSGETYCMSSVYSCYVLLWQVWITLTPLPSLSAFQEQLVVASPCLSPECLSTQLGRIGSDSFRTYTVCNVVVLVNKWSYLVLVGYVTLSLAWKSHKKFCCSCYCFHLCPAVSDAVPIKVIEFL